MLLRDKKLPLWHSCSHFALSSDSSIGLKLLSDFNPLFKPGHKRLGHIHIHYNADFQLAQNALATLPHLDDLFSELTLFYRLYRRVWQWRAFTVQTEK